MKVDQAPAQETGAAARPAQAPYRAPDIHPSVTALVRLLARQAAGEHLERLANADAEETTDEA